MNMFRLGSFLLFLLLFAGAVHAQTSDPLPPEVKAGIQKLPRLQLLGMVDVPAFEKSIASTKSDSAVETGTASVPKPKAIIHGTLRAFLNAFSNLDDPDFKAILGPTHHLERIVFLGDMTKKASENQEICFFTGEFQPGVPPSACVAAMKSVSGKEYRLIRSGPSGSEGGGKDDLVAVAWMSARTVCFGDELLVRAVLSEESSNSVAPVNEDLIQGLDRVGGFVRFAGRFREIAGPEAPQFAGFERMFLGVDEQEESFRLSGFIQSDDVEAAEKVYSRFNVFRKTRTDNALGEGYRQILSVTEITREGVETRFRLSEDALLEVIRMM